MSFTDPQKNIRQFDLREGQHVADFGVGAGAYALAAAERVGHDGRVYAVDIQRNFLTKVSNEAKERGIRNIEIVWGDAEEPNGSKLRDSSMDAVIISNTLFQMENKRGAVREAGRVLKPGGGVLVVDWTESFGGLGPREDHVFPEAEAKRLFQDAGFKFERNIDAGAHHYGMIFKKNKER